MPSTIVDIWCGTTKAQGTILAEPPAEGGSKVEVSKKRDRWRDKSRA